MCARIRSQLQTTLFSGCSDGPLGGIWGAGRRFKVFARKELCFAFQGMLRDLSLLLPNSSKVVSSCHDLLRFSQPYLYVWVGPQRCIRFR